MGGGIPARRVLEYAGYFLGIGIGNAMVLAGSLAGVTGSRLGVIERMGT